MKYEEELKRSMKYLGEQEDTIFVGQQTAYKGNALYNTLEYVSQEKRLEFPVAEEFQMGFCTGLSLENYVPISFYPRMDFIILSLNQMLNHLDKFEEMTNGRHKPTQIIRTAVGSLQPLNGGVQHTQNYASELESMTTNIDVVYLEEAEQIFNSFEEAYRSTKSTILVEYGDYYKIK